MKLPTCKSSVSAATSCAAPVHLLQLPVKPVVRALLTASIIVCLQQLICFGRAGLDVQQANLMRDAQIAAFRTELDNILAMAKQLQLQQKSAAI